MIAFLSKNDHLLSIFFFLLYACTPFIPGFGALDIGETQWLYLAIVNCLGLGVLFFLRDRFCKNIKTPFTIFVAIFGFFIAFCAIGLSWTLNFSETLLYIVHLIIGFITLINLYFFLNFNPEENIENLLKTLSIISIIIGFQVLWIFLEDYTLPRSADLIRKSKLNFSNINIASAYFAFIFPLFFWCVLQFKKWWLGIAILAVFISFSSVLLIGSRTAILSAFISIACCLVYMGIILLKTKKQKRHLTSFAIIACVLIASYLVATNTNRINPNQSNTIKNLYTNVYVTNDDGVKTSDPNLNFSKDNTRVLFYKMTWQDFKNAPILGSGLGTWKLLSKDRYLSQQVANNFITPLHTHNDFLQILAETGIIGFLAYASLFVYLIILLFKSFLNKKENHLSVFIVLSLGVYLIDALLNFPLARPTTQLHFAILCAITLIISSKKSKTKKPLRLSIFLMLACLSIAVLSAQYIKYKALVGNKILLTDFKNNNVLAGEKLTLSYNQARGLVPDFYDIAPDGRSYQYIYSLYATSEGKYDLALAHLDSAIKIVPPRYSSHMNKAIIYKEHKKNIDSAIYHATIGVEKVPFIKNNYTVLLPLLKQKKDTSGYLSKVSQYLKYYPTDPTEWQNYALWHLSKTKDFEAATAILDSGIVANPKAPNLKNVKNIILGRKPVKASALSLVQLKAKGIAFMKKRDYQQAVTLFKQALFKNPNDPVVLLNLGISEIGTKQYQNAITHLTTAINSGQFKNGIAHYNRGVAYELLKNTVKSSADYRTSKRMGYGVAQRLPEQKLNPKN